MSGRKGKERRREGKEKAVIQAIVAKATVAAQISLAEGERRAQGGRPFRVGTQFVGRVSRNSAGSPQQQRVSS